MKRLWVWIIIAGIALISLVLIIRSNRLSGSTTSVDIPSFTPVSQSATSSPLKPTPTSGPPATATTTAESQLTSPLTPTETFSSTEAEPATAISFYTYTIINIYPHDRSAFTQGLVFTDTILYEGTGLHGQSTLRKVDLATGDVLQTYQLPDQFFGEGITIFDDNLVQLTWQSHAGFVYDKESFALQREFTYPNEGWGITHDGQQLILSDGTANLYFLDPNTFKEINRVEVRDQNGPVAQLNELEYIEGKIYANVWKTDRIVIIDPQTGQVTGWVDLAGLLRPEDYQTQWVDVLNGIAYDAVGDRLFVTGKWWPKLFEIELVPLQAQ